MTSPFDNHRHGWGGVQHLVAIVLRHPFAILATAGVVGAVAALRWINRLRSSLPATATRADAPGSFTVLVTLEDILRFRGRIDVYHAAWLQDAEANPVTRIPSDARNDPGPLREEIITLGLEQDGRNEEQHHAVGQRDGTERPVAPPEDTADSRLVNSAIALIFWSEGCVERLELRADAILDAETVARLTRAWIVLGMSRVVITTSFFGLMPMLPVFDARPGGRLMGALIYTVAAHVMVVPAILIRIARFV